MIRGRVQDLGLMALMKLVESQNRPTRILLTDRGVSGEIFTIAGRVTHASVGLLSGSAALAELMSWRDGWFVCEFDNVRVVAEDGGHSGEEVGKRTNRNLEQVVATTLEELEWMIPGFLPEDPPHASLAGLVAMANYILMMLHITKLDTSERIPIQEYLSRTTVRFPQVHVVHFHEGEFSSDHLRKFYLQWRAEDGDRAQYFSEAAKGMVFLIDSLLTRYVVRLERARTREYWLQACDHLVERIKQRMMLIQF